MGKKTRKSRLMPYMLVSVVASPCEIPKSHISVFKTANGNPIYEAFIAPNEKFNLTNAVTGTVTYDGVKREGIWLETSGPFHADKYEIGWVWMNSCIKFLQGTSLVILNTDTLLFETVIPNP